MAEYVIFSSSKRLFDRYFSFWILICCLPLLFLPKINLFSIAERESAGVRIDDLILLVLSVVLFWGHFILQKRLCEIERWVFILTGFSLFSYALNHLMLTFHLLHVHASIFYCLRLLEYFMFFYVGALSFQFVKLSTIIKALFLWNLGLMLLQRTELIGQFSILGYLPTASDRVTGITSFPSEAGLLLSMLFCFLIYDEEASLSRLCVLPAFLKIFIQKTYVYWLFLICVTLVIFTGSRIAILALIVAFCFRIIEDLKKASLSSWIIAFIFTSAAVAVIAIAIMHTDSVFLRSAQLLSFRNFELVEKVWDHIDLSQDPIGRENVRNVNYDTSWWIRIHKWCYALKIYYTHPESYLSGIGPGFAMAALDGGFLRILTEYGVIGCCLFWKIFSSIYHISKQLKWMILVFLINMVFFDAYLAYKPMSLLFFAAGSSYTLACFSTLRCSCPKRPNS
ncbi:MAG: hypothetical protein H0X29_04545 [Parachlamydiaceae bacterium]|nr:hypothetical protein [Parachlamydiaceae bacterium]